MRGGHPYNMDGRQALSGVFVLMGVLDPQYTHLIMESDR